MKQQWYKDRGVLNIICKKKKNTLNLHRRKKDDHIFRRQQIYNNLFRCKTTVRALLRSSHYCAVCTNFQNSGPLTGQRKLGTILLFSIPTICEHVKEYNQCEYGQMGLKLTSERHGKAWRVTLSLQIENICSVPFVSRVQQKICKDDKNSFKFTTLLSDRVVLLPFPSLSPTPSFFSLSLSFLSSVRSRLDIF